MSDEHIYYRSGYKHQLARDFQIKTNIYSSADVDAEFISLDRAGNLLVKSGYAWDSTSGPVPDTHRNLRASLVHDALYQLIRHRHLSRDRHKDKADRPFKKICKQDGVVSPVAHAYYLALKTAGNPATDPKNIKEVKPAP